MDKDFNRELCNRYWFLKCDEDYEVTWYDYVPDGWRKIFLKMCDEIEPFVDEEFEILQIKEKYNQMRVYTNYTNDYIDIAIRTVEKLSKNICWNCGNHIEITGICERCKY